MTSHSSDSWIPVFKSLAHYNKTLPKNFHLKSFDNLDLEKDSQMFKLVEILKNRTLDDSVGLWISGRAGCGKTHLLLALMNHISWVYYHSHIGLNGQVRFWNYADLCSWIRQDPNNFERFDEIRKPNFLFIDDVGVSKTSDFVQEKFYSLINFRNENELPTFVSTNLGAAELKKEFTERFTSRILENSAWIELKSTKDYRSNKFLENMKKYEDVK